MTMRRPPFRYWTEQEADFLLLYLPYWRLETIARHLGRTRKSLERWLERHRQFPSTQHLVTSGDASRLSGLSAQRLTTLARQRQIYARRVPGGRWWLFDPARLPRKDAA